MTHEACTIAETMHAPASWRCIDLISDVHLHAQDPQTAVAWADHLERTPADALFILGDLFEVWVGDDSLKPAAGFGFEFDCCQTLRRLGARMPVYVMRGNRDFLLGTHFAAMSGTTLIPDPLALIWDDHRVLLTHGDAWCTGDTDYMRFRAEVRSPEWQRAFLELPLDERRRQARVMRAHSESRKQVQPIYADVDFARAAQALTQCGADTLIHGHTHQPCDDRIPLRNASSPGHDAPDGVAAWAARHVLSDWDAQSSPPRLEVLRLHRKPEGQSRTIPLRPWMERVQLQVRAGS